MVSLSMPVRRMRRMASPPGRIWPQVFGVAQDLIDLLAHFRLGLREDTLDDVCRHFLDNIDRVIDVQLVDDLLQLRVGKAADEKLLKLRRHLDKCLRRQLLRQKPEQQRKPRLVYVLKHGGDVCGVHGVEQIPQ